MPNSSSPNAEPTTSPEAIAPAVHSTVTISVVVHREAHQVVTWLVVCSNHRVPLVRECRGMADALDEVDAHAFSCSAR